MKVKILSWSRKTGVFKGKSFDNITLYGVSMKNTYDYEDTVLQGYPIEFHQIPIKVRFWNDVCTLPLTEDNLNNLIGQFCNVSFGIRSFDGVTRTVCDSLDIIEGDKINA